LGGFFLFDKHADFDKKAVADHFDVTQFKNCKVLSLENVELWLYRKQLISTDNWYVDSAGAFVGCVGTPVYKGLPYRETLQASLTDFKNGQIDFDKLIGVYCFIFCIKDSISLMLDPLYLYHCFVDKAGALLSSSFLALLKASKEKPNLNKLACLENLTTGYIIGPDTLAEEIQVINRQVQGEKAFKDWQIVDTPLGHKEPSFRGTMDECIALQVQHLRSYVSQASKITKGHDIDCGISGGYDSRLLVALLQERMPGRYHLHTHAVKGHHTRFAEKSVAEEIGSFVGVSVKSIESLPAEEMADNEIQQKLLDSVCYYDGRCNHVMGSYQTTNTRAYRRAILGDLQVGYNGLAGELFRKFDNVRKKRIRFEDWAHLYLFYPGFYAAAGSHPIAAEIMDYVNGKIVSILQTQHLEYLNDFSLRRFAGEIKNVYNYGVRVNAENQLAFFFVPFSDAHTVLKSYNAIPFIGNTGVFQAKMIETLSPQLVMITSNYGFPFNREPFKYKMEKYLTAHMPLALARYKVNRKAYNLNKNLSYYHAMMQKSDVIQENINIIQSLFPQITWKRLMRYPYQFDCSVFIGQVIKSFF